MTTVAPQQVSPERVTSPLVKSLENTWQVIRSHHPELPTVAFVIGAGTGIHEGAIKAGHFVPGRWAAATSGFGTFSTPEIFVAGETLSGYGPGRGPVAVLDTLLHEAAHALADARDIPETSRNGRYHNRRYARLAEELGLRVEQVESIGWSDTYLTEQTRHRYAGALAQLADDLTAFRKTEKTEEAEAEGGGRRGPGRRGSNNGLSLSCPTCHRKIRASTQSHEAGPIICWPCARAVLAAGDGRDDPRACTFTADPAGSTPGDTPAGGAQQHPDPPKGLPSGVPELF